MSSRALLAGLAFVIAAPVAAEETYVFDPAHTQATFAVQHLGFSMQRGQFTKTTGKVTVDRSTKQGSIDVTIDTTTLMTGDPRRDVVAKGEDLLNVAKFPTMTFKSSSIKFDGDVVVGVDGDLTMVGITKPVSLKVTNFMCGENAFNKKAMCGAEATTTIKRSEWGLKYGAPKAFADDIRITIPIEAYKE